MHDQDEICLTAPKYILDGQDRRHYSIDESFNSNFKTIIKLKRIYTIYTFNNELILLILSINLIKVTANQK